MTDTTPIRDPYQLGPMPSSRLMTTVDAQRVHAPLADFFDIAARVEEWPAYLSHYRFVRFRERASDGGGLVEMSANRPFGPLSWPTWWLSEMSVDHARPEIRFKHVGGVTTRMDVVWEFTEVGGGTDVRIVHSWDGPSWPIIGGFAAQAVIGPVFIHGIASRTLAGLARAAERMVRDRATGGARGRLEAAPRDHTRVDRQTAGDA